MSDTLRAQLLAAYADEHRDHLAALRAALAAGPDADFEEAYRHAHSLKGAARAIDLPAVVDLAHGLESLLEAWWQGRVMPDEDMARRAAQVADAIEDLSAATLDGRVVPPVHPALAELTAELQANGVFAPEGADGPVPAASHAAPVPVAATRRVEAGAADRLASSTTRLLTEVERLRAAEGTLWQLAAGLERLAVESAASPWADTVASLRDGLNEALRALDERGWGVGRAAQSLAEDVARLRMVAAESVLGAFGPMVRQLAAEQGKEVVYEVRGLSTLADREVLATLAEAVMHLLRNGVAHGIETPARRRAAGKDAGGRLSLEVAEAGPRLEVRVADDGGGIDTAQLAARAVDRGVMTSTQARRADPDRLRQLVFHPGLSTADALDTTAGRGMGMSIVRQLVNRLQGNVVVRSTAGQGTQVVMTVPLTMMAHRVVLVRIRGQTFGLPAPAVVRLIQLAPDGLRRVGGALTGLLDGAELPLADLGALLGLPGAPVAGGDLSVVVVHTAVETLGLVVDGIIDVRDLSVIPLDPGMTDDSRLVGTVTLERGELALVLSPAGLQGYDTAALSVPLQSPAPALAPLVLVVDDSNTIRTLERSILEAHGYRVQLAVDGRDALERMALQLPDVVVTDIEMPRLDGFGLVGAMRDNARLATVPVVLVSSRAAAEDRQRGMALGADAYIVKTRFDQDELLRTIGRLTA